MINVAAGYEEGEEKRQLINLIANQMKKDYQNWNKDGVDNQRIIDDLCELSDGRIKITVDDVKMFEHRVFTQRRRQTNNNNNQQKRKQ